MLIALVMTGGMYLVVTFVGRHAAVPVPRPAGAPQRAPQPPPAGREAAPAGRGLQAFAEKMPVVVYRQRVGPDFAVSWEYVSPGIREIHGITPKQLEANPDTIFEMVHEDDRDRVESAFEAAWRSGEDLDTEYRIVTPDGRVKWVHNLARGAGREGGEIGVWDGIVLDVTTQKEAASELGAERRDAELASKVKADFLANVSHELRTPLNAIIGFAEGISDGLFGPPDLERYREYTRHISMSARHLKAIIDDILDIVDDRFEVAGAH